MCEQKKCPFVSIVILNFNGKYFVERCVSSVLRTDYSNFEVVFVDNGSTDDSLSIVEKSFGHDSRLQIVAINENLGPDTAINMGFEHASGSYIAILANDTEVDSQWLSHLIEAFEQDGTIGIAQTALLEITRDRIQTNGLLLSDYYMFGYPIGRGKPIETKYPLTYEVSFAGGTAMIIERKLADEIGMFEPIVQFYYDDILLSIKAWLSGKRVVTISKSVVYHEGGMSSQTRYEDSFVEAKICILFDIYYRFQDLAKALFIFTYSISFELMYWLSKKNLLRVSARVHALQWGLRNFGAIWRNRNNHWSKSKISPATLLEKFIRIKVPTLAFYLLPPSRWGKYCENEAKKYENKLIQSR
jgi:hypothetical protein